MASYERFYNPKVLARVGRLELRAKMVVEGVISGMHRSPYHGQSVEFVDHRPYVPGDDLRHLDWKVFGRADRFVLKRYEEDTNLRGHILIDCSESMLYGPRSDSRAGSRRDSSEVSEAEGLNKYDYAATLGASIAYLLQKQHDSVGVNLFDSKLRTQIPASSHPSVLLRIADAMDSIEPTDKTGLGSTLAELAETLPRRGLVVLISDLFSPSEEIISGLQAFALRKHDLIVFHVLEETELTFPFEGNTLFHGLEGYPEVIADPRSLREAYIEALGSYLSEVEKISARLGLDYYRTSTADPLDAAIVAVLSARNRMRTRRA